MREIKFRAWNHIVKRYSDFFDLETFYRTKDVNFNNIIFERYTGRKDKNSVEIYESDIVIKFGNPRPMKVEWFRLAFRFDRVFHMCEIQDKDIEVIGNIRENPELLEEE